MGIQIRDYQILSRQSLVLNYFLRRYFWLGSLGFSGIVRSRTPIFIKDVIYFCRFLDWLEILNLSIISCAVLSLSTCE